MRSWSFNQRLAAMLRQLTAAVFIGLMTLYCGLTQAASLSDVYNSAKNYDAQFASAKFELEAAAQKTPEAASQIMPAATLTGSTGFTSGSTAYTNTPQVQRTFFNYAWTVQLTQPLLRASAIAGISEAQYGYQQALAKFNEEGQNLILRVAQSYFNVVINQENLLAAEEAQKAADEQLVTARRNYSAGTVAITDVYEAASKEEAAQAQRISTVNELEEQKADFERIVGTPPVNLQILGDSSITLHPDSGLKAQWLDSSRQYNCIVVGARSALLAAQEEVKRLKLQRLPTVDLVASFGRNYSTGNITNPVDYSSNIGDKQIGVQASVPIFQGGLRASILEAESLEKKAQSDVQAAERKAISDASQAFSGVLAGIAKVKSLKSALTSAEQSVAGNRVGYKAGIRINSDVLAAEDQRYAVRRDLVKARYDTVMEGLKLRAAAGMLGYRDLLALDAILVDPAIEPSENLLSAHRVDQPYSRFKLAPKIENR